MSDLSGVLFSHGLGSRAQTPEQKRHVIERVLAVWLQHEHLRLGQLLLNVYPCPCHGGARDMYFVEDMDLIQVLGRFYGWQPEEAEAACDQ